MTHIFLQEVSKKDAVCNKVEWFWPFLVVYYVKIRERRSNFFEIFSLKRLQIQKIVVPLHSQSRTRAIKQWCGSSVG